MESDGIQSRVKWITLSIVRNNHFSYIILIYQRTRMLKVLTPGVKLFKQKSAQNVRIPEVNDHSILLIELTKIRDEPA